MLHLMAGASFHWNSNENDNKNRANSILLNLGRDFSNQVYFFNPLQLLVGLHSWQSFNTTIFSFIQPLWSLSCCDLKWIWKLKNYIFTSIYWFYCKACLPQRCWLVQIFAVKWGPRKHYSLPVSIDNKTYTIYCICSCHQIWTKQIRAIMIKSFFMCATICSSWQDWWM